MLWLFDVKPDLHQKFSWGKITDSSIKNSFLVNNLLSDLDLIPNDVFDFQIEDMLEAFKGRFPTTKEFSKYARNSLDDTSLILEDPDQLLINWMEQEEFLFRALEKTIVSERLMEGFVLANGVDIDGFLSFSLSVQKSKKIKSRTCF